MSTTTTAPALWLPPADAGLTRLDGEVWLGIGDDGEHRPVWLDDMSAEHRWRLLQWLRRNAEKMQGHERAHLASLHRARTISLERFVARIGVLDATGPEVWIEDTPLVRRLHDLIRRDRDGRRCGR